MADLDDRLVQQRREGRRVPFVYVVPNFQNPTKGSTDPNLPLAYILEQKSNFTRNFAAGVDLNLNFKQKLADVGNFGLNLDGTLTKVTNQSPFAWEWDTTRAANGPHLIEIRGADDRGSIVNTVLTRVLVDN